jgi:perosamine synthetase
LSSTMSDTKRSVPFARPWVTDDDRAAVQRVLTGHVLTHGPECKAFEEGFARFMGGDAHCVTVSSCMAALHLAYLHFEIGPGDEVIVPAQTHVATAHSVEMVGARPVFVDADPATGNVTADRIAAAIGERTRAISVVHYAGIAVDMPPIAELAREHDLRVVEDCALAVGARIDGTHVGLFGDVGCYSFYPVKHLTTGEGGMFVSRDEEIARRVARKRAFGVDRAPAERKVPGVYDVPEAGLNYRMSEMQAALGRSQLERIDENLRRRAENFATIRAAVDGVAGARVVDDPRAGRSTHYCLTLILDEELAERRADLIADLNGRGVGTSIYYPRPVPQLAYYRARYGVDPASHPVATQISDWSIALPVGPHMKPEDAAWVGEQVVASMTGLS